MSRRKALISFGSNLFDINCESDRSNGVTASEHQSGLTLWSAQPIDHNCSEVELSSGSRLSCRTLSSDWLPVTTVSSLLYGQTRSLSLSDQSLGIGFGWRVAQQFSDRLQVVLQVWAHLLPSVWLSSQSSQSSHFDRLFSALAIY